MDEDNKLKIWVKKNMLWIELGLICIAIFLLVLSIRGSNPDVADIIDKYVQSKKSVIMTEYDNDMKFMKKSIIKMELELRKSKKETNRLKVLITEKDKEMESIEKPETNEDIRNCLSNVGVPTLD